MGKDFLAEIIAHKKKEVNEAERRIPMDRLVQSAGKQRNIRSFFSVLKQRDKRSVNIIAEIKRASPSKGDIRLHLDPEKTAEQYEAGGAAALSVLTDRRYFKGSPDDLRKAREASALPVLRKDFLISSYQIYESYVMGADAVLLIARVLTPKQLKKYLSLCRSLSIDALVEIHSKQDFESAAEAGATLIGINNRNLETFETDIRIAMELSRLLSPDQVAVAASGINSREDIEQNLEIGICNFLIGESLVRSPDPGSFLSSLIG